MTALEDAQVRVATAQEEKDRLQDEVHKKYGSQSDLDMHCRGDTYSKKGGPRDLRRRYGAATKELRLAKSDLARMRNEEQQKPAYMAAMDEAAEKAEKKSEPMSVVFSDEGVSINGKAPLPPEVVSAAIDVVKGRKNVQLDLEGNKAKAPLSGRIKVPPERFELETPSWVLKGPKEVMLELVREGQRPAVKGRVQKGLRAKKDAIINDGDFDLAVERFTDEIMRGIIHRLPEDD